MTVTLDRFGRVLIPKRVRDRLGLVAGAELALEVRFEGDAGASLALTPASDEPLVVRESMLIHTGKLDDAADVVETVRLVRGSRTDELARQVSRT